MKKIHLKAGNYVNMIDNIGEMSAYRYNLLNKYQIIESGIGSDVEAISGHYANLFKLIAEKKNTDALREAENLLYTYHFVLTGVNIQHLSFALFVHDINGQKKYDISEEGLNETIKELSEHGLTQEMVNVNLVELKKKFEKN